MRNTQRIEIGECKIKEKVTVNAARLPMRSETEIRDKPV